MNNYIRNEINELKNNVIKIIDNLNNDKGIN